MYVTCTHAVCNIYIYVMNVCNVCMVWYGMVWYGMVWYGMVVMYVCMYI